MAQEVDLKEGYWFLISYFLFSVEGIERGIWWKNCENGKLEIHRGEVILRSFFLGGLIDEIAFLFYTSW